ncbi:MAG: asparagine synthase (glutamine-hydrolyzing) [Tumebacillaceae bacterium]
MTGIAGFHNWNSSLQEKHETLVSMTKILSHRRVGTDQLHEFADAHVMMTTGSLRSSDGITVAVEGFFYNHAELRQELTASGFRLVNDEVADLVQAAYLHWGDAFVERLYGAFAIVLWDEREQRLLLGRDQLGVKPLHFAERQGTVVFGSEIKALLLHPLVTREVDAIGLTEIMCKAPNFSPGQALFRDVQEVKPGHLVIFTPNGSKHVTYWEVESHRHEDSVEETMDKLHDMVESNVLHLKEIGLAQTSILSGGLDSSGLIAMVCRTHGPDYKTYSGNTPECLESDGFEDRDAPWVDRVAAFLGNPNEEVMVDYAAIMESKDRSRSSQDMPTLANYDTMIYRVFKRIRERGNLSVLLGEGSDELFGTHAWFYEPELINQPFTPWNNKYTSILASPDLLRNIKADEYMKDNYQDFLRRVPRLAEDTPVEARLREIFYLSLKEYLPTILRRNDRMSMSQNLNASIPFADPRFAQYVWNIPWEMKNQGGRTKGILRESFRRLLPDNVVYRRKGVNPLVFSDRYSDFLSAEFEQLLQDPQAPVFDLVDREKIRELLDSKIIYRDKYVRFRFDYFLQINQWLREYNVVLK